MSMPLNRNVFKYAGPLYRYTMHSLDSNENARATLQIKAQDFEPMLRRYWPKNLRPNYPGLEMFKSGGGWYRFEIFNPDGLLGLKQFFKLLNVYMQHVVAPSTVGKNPQNKITKSRYVVEVGPERLCYSSIGEQIAKRKAREQESLCIASAERLAKLAERFNSRHTH